MGETETTPSNWRSEFIQPRRFPRWCHTDIESLILRAKNVQISLKQRKNESLVIVKFPASTMQLPKGFQDNYSQLGISFSEVLWKKPRQGSSSLWSEIAGATHKAYCEAWHHLLESLYSTGIHPDADKWIQDSLEYLRKNSTSRVGRRRAVDAEKVSLENRFKELLADCKNIREVVEMCVRLKRQESDIRSEVYKNVKAKRFAMHLLTREGNAFNEIPYGGRSKIARLSDTNSWRPHQLAIALLALERGLTYHTVEKKIASTRKPARQK